MIYFFCCYKKTLEKKMNSIKPINHPTKSINIPNRKNLTNNTATTTTIKTSSPVQAPKISTNHLKVGRNTIDSIIANSNSNKNTTELDTIREDQRWFYQGNRQAPASLKTNRVSFLSNSEDSYSNDNLNSIRLKVLDYKRQSPFPPY
jgi:hypothetical protein